MKSALEAVLPHSTGQQIKAQSALLDLTGEALIIRDAEDRIRFWNSGAERLYEWRAAEAMGRNVQELLQETSKPGFDSAVSENESWVRELRHVTKNGKVVFVRSRTKLIRDESGAPESVLIANTDITDRKAMESQVLRMQRGDIAGRLASGIAHDLGNGLAPMLFSVRMLEHERKDDQDRRWLETLRVSTEHVARVVTSLLSFVKGGAERCTPICPGELIEEVAEMLRSAFPRSIRIQVAVDGNLSRILGNFTHIEQAFMNLCLNARDAMPRGGVLSIEAENVGQDDSRRYVLIKITDTGAGIPADITHKLFDPFFTTKDPGHGTGLGLFMVSRILMNHDGYIRVSTTPGQGTQFQIYLPAEV